MIYSHAEFLKIIHDTQAVKIWNRQKGPVFWYAAAVPGPFYVNTEYVIGPELAAKLLEQITAIVASTTDPASRAKQLNDIILPAYENDTTYRNIIESLVDKAKAEFPGSPFSLVSGGERRDWLFSIPFAKLLGCRHAFIFKNRNVYCAESLKENEKALHVADLINNAASYFDAWFPALKAAHIACVGTVCVNSRGSNGVKRLTDIGQKVVALNSVDLGFFDKSLANGLIDGATRDEIATFFASSKDWASKYLLGDLSNTRLFDVENIDAKSLERMAQFFQNDPWGLRDAHTAFFQAMKEKIAARQRR